MGYWPLLLPVLFVLRRPNGFPYPSGEALYSDVAISHYPYLVYLKRALMTYGTVPWWSPGIYSGTPMAGNPLASLWYPGGWLAVITPLPLGINLAAGLHLLWGGVGLYRYLVESGIGKRGAIFGALGWMSAPKIMAHYGAGHLTLVYAVMWTPWLIWAAKRSEERGGGWNLLPGVVMGMIMLADPRWSVYAGVLWIAWVAAYSQGVTGEATKRRQQGSVGLDGWSVKAKMWTMSLVKVGGQSALGLLIASPLIVPMLELTRLSTRASLTPEELTTFSLPPARLLGLFYPDYGGNHEFTVYPGVMVMVLVLVTMFFSGKGKLERFWLWSGWGALALGLGSYLPGYERLTQLPGLQYLRVPSRAIFLTAMAFAVVGATSLDRLMKGTEEQSIRRVALGLTAVSGVLAALAMGVWVLTPEFPVSFVVGAGLMVVASLWVGSGMRNGRTGRLWFLGLVGLAILDWGFFDRSVLDFRSADVVRGEQSAVVDFLEFPEGRFRVYSPSYSLPQQVAADHGLELADGVDPLAIQLYADYMVNATGVPRRGYSVTIPPFENGDPSQDNADYRPDARALGWLNVGYVVSEFDLAVDGLEYQAQFGETRIYKNQEVRARAWLQPDDVLGEVYTPVDVAVWSPNLIEIEVEGPGLLVLAEVVYPGWGVAVDGQAADMEVVAGILRGVWVGAGNHAVQFKMRPLSVYAGLGGFALGFGLMGGYWVCGWRRHRRLEGR